ncbi:MAG: protoheme IX farnesyltransferase [Gammaproteobacteria bacterium TMED95]|jgi:protoheme IX farnesyltransferase|nr:protoheme IX farnesyltransferase [Gammaproteobacteria bacterium]OUV19224.1 MAG: protoheme IX farnesyltransferase [Gammaproteobacteria bacterium TMED95]|tara:strand:+ start:2347 stop:3258 length:912 start_codon:yes stop_codon:yes gene_type:complete
MAMSETVQSPALPAWRDYYEMCKPRVVLLMLLCTLVGMFLATSAWVSVSLIVNCLLGVALVAGSAAALNHLIDASVDQKMARTENRPVAQGRVTTVQGLIFVGVTGALGLAILAVAVNPLTAWLNFFSWLGYGLIYTLYLKRATSQNIVIGGLFGAAPPLFGWTAVTNSIDGGGLLLVLIIFAWTPPHFWALAIDRLEEYKKVDIPMLPITHGVAYTKLHIVLYTILLIITSVLPFVIGMSNVFYLVSALALGAGFLYWSLIMLWDRNPDAPIETFKYSILYLALLFLALLIDHYMMPVTYAQ